MKSTFNTFTKTKQQRLKIIYRAAGLPLRVCCVNVSLLSVSEAFRCGFFLSLFEFGGGPQTGSTHTSPRPSRKASIRDVRRYVLSCRLSGRMMMIT